MIVSFFPDNSLQVTAVSCGFNHMMAIVENHYCYTWGGGLFGQLGLDDSIDSCLTPMKVSFSNAQNIKKQHEDVGQSVFTESLHDKKHLQQSKSSERENIEYLNQNEHEQPITCPDIDMQDKTSKDSNDQAIYMDIENKPVVGSEMMNDDQFSKQESCEQKYNLEPLNSHRPRKVSRYLSEEDSQFEINSIIDISCGSYSSAIIVSSEHKPYPKNDQFCLQPQASFC